MGGDNQPQVLLQLLARLLVSGHAPGDAVAAPRWRLTRPGHPFALWAERGPSGVEVEAHAPTAWVDGLADRAHAVTRSQHHGTAFGHAQVIEVTDEGMLAGAADPRADVGAVAAC